MWCRYRELLDLLSESETIPMTATFTAHITTYSQNNSSITSYKHISPTFPNTTSKHSRTTFITTSTTTSITTSTSFCASTTFLQYPKAEIEFTHISIPAKNTSNFKPSTISLPNSDTPPKMFPQNIFHHHKVLKKTHTTTPKSYFKNQKYH